MIKVCSEVTLKPFLYLAAPLFSFAEKKFNEDLSRLLGKYFTVYLPQRDGGLFLDLIAKGLSRNEAARHIFSLDTRAIENSDFVLAILDGRAIDEGVAVELGYAFALKKSCYGLQTDSRRLLPEGNNPMVTGTLTRIVETIEDLSVLCEEIVAFFRSKNLKSDRLGQTINSDEVLEKKV